MCRRPAAVPPRRVVHSASRTPGGVSAARLGGGWRERERPLLAGNGGEELERRAAHCHDCLEPLAAVPGDQSLVLGPKEPALADAPRRAPARGRLLVIRSAKDPGPIDRVTAGAEGT